MQALFAGFLEADAACRGRFKTSGTTATLALLAGWTLLIANVGDSAAYLDTGKEVLALTANHRVDDNAAERARVTAAGGACRAAPCCGLEARAACCACCCRVPLRVVAWL